MSRLRDGFLERARNGMTFPEYMQFFAESVETVDLAGLSGEELIHARFLPLNLQRSRRNLKTFVVAEGLRAATAAITIPQLWLVLTEPWCGDSAQNLPLIAKTAETNPLITLRMLLRDKNPDIMDRYLTNGKRAIPKLVMLSASGGEPACWGPRPKEAAELFARGKTSGESNEKISEKLHLWYGRDRGRAFCAEFTTLLSAAADRAKGPCHDQA